MVGSYLVFRVSCRFNRYLEGDLRGGGGGGGVCF